jgi:hypothetical protein
MAPGTTRSNGNLISGTNSESKSRRTLSREQFNDLVRGHENLPDLVSGRWVIDEKSLESTTVTLDDVRAVTILFMETV